MSGNRRNPTVTAQTQIMQDWLMAGRAVVRKSKSIMTLFNAGANDLSPVQLLATDRLMCSLPTLKGGRRLSMHLYVSSVAFGQACEYERSPELEKD